MYKTFKMRFKDGTTRTVTEFPWVAKQVPCPWNDNKYARVMVPFTRVEQCNHKHPKQHTQIVLRSRLTEVRPAELKVA